MSYTVEQLIWAIRLGRVSAGKETGAALILSAAEQMQLAPLEMSARGISLSAAGAVILGEAGPSDGLTCDRQLRLLLDQLLRCCGGEHLQLERVAAAPARGVGELAAELSAALIPFNRSASRRALTRLYRRIEAAGAVPAGEISLDFSALESERRAAAKAQHPADRSLPTPVIPSRGGVQPCRASASECRTPDSPQVSERTPFWGSAAPPVLGRKPETEDSECAARSTSQAVEVGSARGAAADVTLTPGPVENPADQRAAQLLFGRFEARRSDLGTLVSEFAMEAYPEAQLTAQALCRSFDEQTDWSSVNCTPMPPSATDARTSG